MQRLGRLQFQVLVCLKAYGALSCSELARGLNVNVGGVYDCLRRLKLRGYVDCFPWHVNYYGCKGVYMQLVRLYCLTVKGRQVLESFGDVGAPLINVAPKAYGVDQFRVWGSRGALNRKALKEAWAGFKSQREKLKAKLQA